MEFMDKKKARRVAAMLNGQPIGSKNRGFYEHDLWTIKYASPWRQWGGGRLEEEGGGGVGGQLRLSGSARASSWRRARALSVILTVMRQVPLKVQVEALDRWAIGFGFKQLQPPPPPFDLALYYLQKNWRTTARCSGSASRLSSCRARKSVTRTSTLCTRCVSSSLPLHSNLLLPTHPSSAGARCGGHAQAQGQEERRGTRHQRFSAAAKSSLRSVSTARHCARQGRRCLSLTVHAVTGVPVMRRQC